MILENCRLCARSCGVNRMKNRAGRCGQTEELVVARAALHMWEEPCISGKEGSGAVFFVGCPLGCVFCQNREIARGRVARDESSRAENEISHRRGEQSAAEVETSYRRDRQPIEAEETSHRKGELPAAAGEISYRKGELPAAEVETSYRRDRQPIEAEETSHRNGELSAAADEISRQRVEQSEAVSDNPGKIITIDRLAEIFLELQGQKANNINLVTPTHYVPQIVEAVREARKKGLHIPIVYNTGSIETPETVHMLEDTVDIFLPDLKFCGRNIAGRYAHLPAYFNIATKAIGEMVRMRGEAAFDERGMMTRGVIVRHMVLPGHTKDSKEILRYLWENFGDRIYVSIMNQYTPMPGIEREFPELGRRVTRREYDRVVDYALELGFSNAFVQEGPTAEESFIPAFDGAGV